jgi:hypothetical protein
MNRPAGLAHTEKSPFRENSSEFQRVTIKAWCQKTDKTEDNLHYGGLMPLILFLALFSTSLAQAEEYCVAIRGNGENVGAHWASLSRLIDENGLPEAMAGGSSASITQFLVNSVAGNPSVAKETNPEKKRKKAALLVKSFSEFFADMGQTEESTSAQAFMTELGRDGSTLADKLRRLASGSGGVSAGQLSSALQKFYPLLNPEITQGLLTRPAFFKGEVNNAVKVFGQFDAVEDKNLFIRPGLVDFKEAAVNFGTVADFYEGNTDPQTAKELENFTEQCADSLHRKHWGDLPNDGCKARFRRIAANYLKQGDFKHRALFEPVGKHIKSIPTTALVQGEAVNRYQDLKTSYSLGETNRDYSDFKVDFERELKFGYFTNDGDSLKRGLAPRASRGDLKSAKFEAIPNENWFGVLATSPAEPGLASLQPIPQNASREQVLAERRKPVTQRWNGLPYRRGVLSAGGWSDLHPTAVLKASGCKRVVYITRKDGEAVFGQQIFIRLTGTESEVPFWKELKTNNNAGWRVSGETERSAWNRLYNYGNPQSSFNQALGSADIAYCTDWNRFSPFNGEGPAMEKEAYLAPTLLTPGMPETFRVNKTEGSASASLYPGCLPMRANMGARPNQSPSAAVPSAQ